MWKCALVLVALLAAASARADAPTADAPSPAPADALKTEEVAVQAWGEKHPECRQWSDGCVACTAEGCSTPGIACTPREIACRKP